MSIIENAVKIVQDYYETEGIFELSSTLYQRGDRWRDKLAIDDARTLAAAIISGEYEIGTTIEDVQAMEKFYFSSPLETLSQLEDFMKFDNPNNINVEDIWSYLHYGF